jgi:hypothetical protein
MHHRYSSGWSTQQTKTKEEPHGQADIGCREALQSVKTYPAIIGSDHPLVTKMVSAGENRQLERKEAVGRATACGSVGFPS